MEKSSEKEKIKFTLLSTKYNKIIIIYYYYYKKNLVIVVFIQVRRYIRMSYKMGT